MTRQDSNPFIPEGPVSTYRGWQIWQCRGGAWCGSDRRYIAAGAPLMGFQSSWGLVQKIDGLMARTPRGITPQINPQKRRRPQVINNTICTDTGRTMRGATMDIRKLASPPCANQKIWNNYRAAGLNYVRLGVKTDHDGAGYSVATQIPFIDAAVECAAQARMYVMILVSIAPGDYDLTQLTEFWTAVAPRYANEEHVLYEITNEPVSGGGKWGQTSHWTSQVLTDLRGVYDIMRRAARDTHMMMFCTPNLYPDAASWKTVPEGFDAAGTIPVDWSKVSISYHHYPGTYLFGDPDGFGGITAMKGYGYNMFMSECNDFIGDAPSLDPRNSEIVWLESEQYNISWVCLDGKDGTISTQITSKIMPYLAANGYALPVE